MAGAKGPTVHSRESIRPRRAAIRSARYRAHDSTLRHLVDKIVRTPTRGNACTGFQIQRTILPAIDLIPVRTERLALAKILVVDDDSAVQATIRLLLERAGHNVVVASDGRQGLAVFESGEFDLLFLDIFMPGMDGLETMRLVHQQQPLIPIIVISGNPVTWDSASGPDFLTMATKLGAVSSLQKPFKPAALLAAVAGCLEAAKRSSSSSTAAGEVASGP
jgi:CheY-like chemotaxis protein